MNETAAALAKRIVGGSQGPEVGSLMYAERQARLRQQTTKAARLREIIAAAEAAEKRSTVEVSVHPTTAARGHRRPGGGALSDSDRLWLSRLPTDPTKLPYEDAVELAALVQSIDAMKHPSDHRLAMSVWRGVDRFHSQHIAEQRLKAARRPLAEVPACALDLIAAAVAEETTELQPDEIVGRASTFLREALDQRAADRANIIHEAEATITKLNADQAKREQVLV